MRTTTTQNSAIRLCRFQNSKSEQRKQKFSALVYIENPDLTIRLYAFEWAGIASQYSLQNVWQAQKRARVILLVQQMAAQLSTVEF